MKQKHGFLAILIGLMLGIPLLVKAQSFNQERAPLERFIIRMFENEPFEGIKIVADYDNCYLLSVVIVNPSSNELTMNRIAQLKSQRQVSQYLNGRTSVDSETIIRMTEDTDGNPTLDRIDETIREYSVGFTKSLETLSSFKTKDGKQCYMFYRNMKELKE